MDRGRGKGAGVMDAYPLQWPLGWSRSKYPQPDRFKVSMGEAVDHLYNELERLGASNVIVSSNMRLRIDGRPLANQNRLDDEGVAVYFMLSGAQQCIPCDKWDTVKGNLRAIGLTVQALRGLDRWGAKEMVNAAFRGFKALPESVIVTPYTARAWHEVLQVTSDADWDIVDAAYKRMLHKTHPDKGGTTETFQEVQKAYKEAKGIYGKANT